MVTKGVKREWDELGDKIDIQTLVYIKWITNNNLLYTTENYIQCPITTYNGKNLKKYICMYVHIYENHFAAHL